MNQKTLDRFRTRLASVDALPQLSLLGIASGIFAGAIILLFRFVVEFAQSSLLNSHNPEYFEGLDTLSLLFLPLIGGLVIGLILHRMHPSHVATGVVHVLERLVYHQGHLPFKNFLNQFVCAAIAIISGHSVGREGPGVHLGAASASFIGQGLKLPNNSVRILVACGAAASIAASFNTPIAGVIFAMEVIVMEYTIAGFTPVILAAVTATVLTQLVYGGDPAFSLPMMQLGSLKELPLFLVMGICIGALSALFIATLNRMSGIMIHRPIWQRTSLAGLLTGIIAVFVPQIMGIGYDTVNAALLGQLSISILLLILVFKLLATTLSVGLGIPGGLIGPNIVMGACAGALFGLLADSIFSGSISSSGFYAMIGMGAMMGATLQAPLAALLAMLELTLNAHILLPGMLVVVTACMTSSHVFKQGGVFMVLLRSRGLDYKHDPVAQSLRRVGVASAINRAFVRTVSEIGRQQAQSLTINKPEWIVVDATDGTLSLLLAADLVRYLGESHEDPVDLLEIPATRYDVEVVNFRDTLQHALDIMNKHQLEVLCVGQTDSKGQSNIIGIITRQMIEAHYKR